MKKVYLVLLSLVAGTLLSAAWPARGFTPLLFVGFLPFLVIEQHITVNSARFSRFSVFSYTWPGFFLWNVLTTWWIWNSTPVAVMAWFLNALFMAMVFQLFHVVRKKTGVKGFAVPAILISFWISFEYFHQNWDLTWPWLNLGNGLNRVRWIQWYEYTGTLGGTLWILGVNYLFFYLFFLKKTNTLRQILRNMAIVVLAVGIPMILSMIIYHSYKETGTSLRTVVVQPNLDPYSEQYTIPPAEVAGQNLELAARMADKETRLIVCPESAIQEGMWEPEWDGYQGIQKFRSYLMKNPEKAILIGASTYRRLDSANEREHYSRFSEEYGFWYNAHNTALFIDRTSRIQLHHKSKLTPGVEKMPSWKILRPLEKFAIDLGGTIGSLGPDKDQIPVVMDDSIRIAPVICYESVYGEFCGNFVKNGANLLCIITNDGWWGNTPGHRQHFEFAKLRAIESRKSIARSANTGISAFVNQRGDTFQETEYWKEAVIKGDVLINDKVTFYARSGDYLGRISAFIAALLVIMSIVRHLIRKKA